MAKRSFSINDETDRLLNYYLNRSEKDWDSVINEAIKYTLQEALDLTKQAEITVDGLFSGPQHTCA